MCTRNKNESGGTISLKLMMMTPKTFLAPLWWQCSHDHGTIEILSFLKLKFNLFLLRQQTPCILGWSALWWSWSSGSLVNRPGWEAGCCGQPPALYWLQIVHGLGRKRSKRTLMSPTFNHGRISSLYEQKQDWLLFHVLWLLNIAIWKHLASDLQQCHNLPLH